MFRYPVNALRERLALAMLAQLPEAEREKLLAQVIAALPRHPRERVMFGVPGFVEFATKAMRAAAETAARRT